MYAFRGKSNEELISMGIAPVSRNHWIQTTGGKVSTPTGNESGSQATAKTSKRQLKKERQKKRAKAFCFNFARGICDKGGACKFSHEVEAYIANRQPDLPGQCPYSNYSICPFGVLCRWANSHVIKDDLTQKAFALHDPSKQAHPQPPIGNKDGMLSPLDGEIPGHSQIALPILPQLPAPQNTLSKDLQQKLWKKQFDFRSADRLVKELQSGKGGSFSKASLQSNEAERDLQPSSKKQKIEVGGNALQTATDTISPEVVRPNEKEHLQNSDREMNGNANTAQAVLKASEDNCQKAEPAGHQRAREEINPLAGLEAGLSKSSSNEEPAQKSTKDVGKARNGLSELEDNAMALLYDAREANMETETTFINTPLHANEKRKIDFKGKLYLAPLTTVGNLPFRRVCKGLGADITCGEMAVATNLLQGQASEWALLKRDSSEDCFGVQICGGYPDHMTRCAALLEDNIDVDFVDINMGCPIDLICCKGAGSALLTKPNRMEQVVRGVSSMLSCPLSIKVRRGYNDGQDVAHDILPCVKEWGASAATLHGRSRQQRYSREADWDYIAKCVQAAKPLPLIGNGDIFAYTDYEDHIKNIPGLATTMIARGALIKPWIFTEIKERRHWDISASERLDILKKFCSTGLLHWGSDEKGVETTRRFLLEWLSYLCRYIPVGLLEVLPQKVGWRPPLFKGRSDLETLLSSFDPQDWIKISEMLLGPVPGGFSFQAKHKSNAYASSEKTMSLEGDQENG